jgi:hypothetical protein
MQVLLNIRAVFQAAAPDAAVSEFNLPSSYCLASAWSSGRRWRRVSDGPVLVVAVVELTRIPPPCERALSTFFFCSGRSAGATPNRRQTPAGRHQPLLRPQSVLL